MATPKFVCGGECGIAVVGTTSAGTEHWSAAGTGFATVTSPVRSGARSYQLSVGVGTTSTQMSATHTFASAIASGGTIVARFYIAIGAGLTNSGDRMALFSTTDGLAGIELVNAFGAMVILAWAGNATRVEGTSGPVIPTDGSWHKIDVRITRGTTITVDWAQDGVAQATASKGSQTAVTIPGFVLGQNPVGTASSSVTGTATYLDDIYVCGQSGDYPLPEGKVIGLYPNSDRTNSTPNPIDGNAGHLYSAVSDFGKGSGGGTNVGAQNAEATAWQSLANPLSTTIATNMVTCKTSTNTEHMVFGHDTMPPSTEIHAVMVVAATHSATATANSFVLKLANTVPQTVAAIGPVDLSETTITVPVAIITTAPDGSSAWTTENLNTTYFRFGDTADASPNIHLDGVCLEVDYSPLIYKPLVVDVAMRRASVR